MTHNSHGTVLTQQRYSAFADRFAKMLAIVAGVGVAALMVMINADVVRRWVTGAAIPGVVEYGELAMVIIVYFSIGYTQLDNRHVTVDIFTAKFPKRFARGLDITVLFGMGIFLLWVSWQTGITAYESFETGERHFGSVQASVWPARLAISVGFLSMALQCVAQALRLSNTRRESRQKLTNGKDHRSAK